jgi:hypothetical protein
MTFSSLMDTNTEEESLHTQRNVFGGGGLRPVKKVDGPHCGHV